MSFVAWSFLSIIPSTLAWHDNEHNGVTPFPFLFPDLRCPFTPEPQLTAFDCITPATGICRDGLFFGIDVPSDDPSDNAVILIEPTGEIIYSSFDGAVRLCVGEDPWAASPWSGGDTPYLAVSYDSGRSSAVLHCYGAYNDNKNAVLKIVDSDEYQYDFTPYYQHTTPVVKFKKGPGYDNALWIVDGWGEEYTSPQCKWKYSSECDDDEFEEFIDLFEFELLEECPGKIGNPPDLSTTELINEVLRQFFNQEQACDDLGEPPELSQCGIDEITELIELIEWEVVEDPCVDSTRTRGRRLQRRKRSRGRGRRKGRSRRGRKRRPRNRVLHTSNTERVANGSGIVDNRHRTLQQDLTCPPDLTELFVEKDEVFSDVIDADITEETELSCQPGDDDCEDPNGLCCTDECFCRSAQPSMVPSNPLSSPPSALPSTNPSVSPSVIESSMPSTSPSKSPSLSPSSDPSLSPSILTSGEPSRQPSISPSDEPSASPSDEPSRQPSISPTQMPTSCDDGNGIGTFAELNETISNATDPMNPAQIEMCPGIISFTGDIDVSGTYFVLSCKDDVMPPACTLMMNGFSFVGGGGGGSLPPSSGPILDPPMRQRRLKGSIGGEFRGRRLQETSPDPGDRRLQIFPPVEVNPFSIELKDMLLQAGNPAISVSGALGGESPQRRLASRQASGGDYNVTLKACIFKDNESPVTGGAVNVGGVNLKVFDCRFISNSASEFGGAVYWFSDDPDLSVDIQRCTFENNVAASDSGAMEVESVTGGTEAVSILQCKFLNNTANGEVGGAFSIFGDSSVLVDRCNFTDNSADSGGGGIYHFGEMLTILKSNFDGNSADSGGGIIHQTGILNISNSNFDGNSASTDGGAIYDEGDELVISDCQCLGNSATGDGGCLWTSGDSDTFISGTTFVDNTAADGHDIYFVDFGKGGGGGSMPVCGSGSGNLFLDACDSPSFVSTNSPTDVCAGAGVGSSNCPQ